MKKLLYFTLTLGLASTALGQTRDKPKVTYDKFKDNTFIMLNFKRLPSAADYEDDFSNISLYASHAGKEPCKFDASESVALGIYRSGKGWRFLNHHDLELMCGSKRIRAEVDYDSEIDKGECTETITTQFTLGDLRRHLEKNQDWEVKVGWEVPFTFSASERKKMLEFVKFLESGEG